MGKFTIQFDHRIFFKWVGEKNHPPRRYMAVSKNMGFNPQIIHLFIGFSMKFSPSILGYLSFIAAGYLPQRCFSYSAVSMRLIGPLEEGETNRKRSYRPADPRFFDDLFFLVITIRHAICLDMVFVTKVVYISS